MIARTARGASTVTCAPDINANATTGSSRSPNKKSSRPDSSCSPATSTTPRSSRRSDNAPPAANTTAARDAATPVCSVFSWATRPSPTSARLAPRARPRDPERASRSSRALVHARPTRRNKHASDANQSPQQPQTAQTAARQPHTPRTSWPPQRSTRLTDKPQPRVMPRRRPLANLTLAYQPHRLPHNLGHRNIQQPRQAFEMLTLSPAHPHHQRLTTRAHHNHTSPDNPKKHRPAVGVRARDVGLAVIVVGALRSGVCLSSARAGRTEGGKLRPAHTQAPTPPAARRPASKSLHASTPP